MARAFAAALALWGAILWPGTVLAQQTATRSAGFAYDSATGLLTQEVVEPDLVAFRRQSDYALDAFGNKAGVTVTGADIAARSMATAYDARGRFIAKVTNGLGQSESRAYDPRFGTPISHTDPNGLIITWAYDEFGRKLQEVRPDGTKTTYSYDYCSGIAGGTAACPKGATHRIEARHYGVDGVTEIRPLERTFFDELERELAAATEGFDGRLVNGTVEYDHLGRVVRLSRPYFEGDTPRWATVNYDVLDRAVLETFADGSTLAHAYHGLTTIDTNAFSQTTTTVKDSQGRIVSVTDALGKSISYLYDPFGNPVRVTDPLAHVSTYAYDHSGRRIAASDPDLGAWSYTYDVLDQLTSQTDAKGQTTTLTYDLIGRMTVATAPDLTATWTYDTAPLGIGKVAIGKLAVAATNDGYSRGHSYDALGRPAKVSLTIDGKSYAIATSYDEVSRVSKVAYPSGFTVRYGYNARSFQSQLSNAATDEVYWTAHAHDAELRLTKQTFGNGVVTDRVFDPATGRLLGIQAGTGAAVQNLGYAYDFLGNLLSRTDANTAVSETFAYDALNRLTSSKVDGSPAKTFAYDAIGNLTFKSGVGNYSYPAPGQPRPHAVTSISGDVINTTFTYDANGNRLTGNGITMAYSSFNKPVSITRGTVTVSFVHDPEQQRHKQMDPSGETLYLADELGSGVLVEKLTGAGGLVQWTNYLFAAGEMVGMKVERSDETAHLRYFHKDHLSSIAALTDEGGTAMERLSYDAWGKRRFPNGNDDPAGSLTSQTTRGFTGQEQLDDVGLVHMNGRVYDPLTGQFGSADPTTPQPFTTLGWNRYAYANNSPLTFIDPSGYESESSSGSFQVASNAPITTGPIEAGPGPEPGSAPTAPFSPDTGVSGVAVKSGTATPPSLLDLTGRANVPAMTSGTGTPSGSGTSSSSQGPAGISPPSSPLTPGQGGGARGHAQTAHTNAQAYLNAGMTGASTIPGLWQQREIRASDYIHRASDRKLTGPGHHMLTNQVANQYNWSAGALRVFDAPFGEGGGRMNVPPSANRFDAPHRSYNRQLEPFVRDYLQRTGIDPSKMTEAQAKEMVRALKLDPTLRQFNQRTYMRGIQFFMRNTLERARQLGIPVNREP